MKIILKVLSIGLAVVVISCSSNETINYQETPLIELTLECVQSNNISADDSLAQVQLLKSNFSPPTRMEFGVPERDSVKIALYDIKGTAVTKIYTDFLEPGRYFVKPNAIGLKSGVYFFHLVVGPIVKTKNVVILK